MDRNSPGRNGQPISMDRPSETVQPPKVSRGFEDQNNARPQAGQSAIMESLANSFGPLRPKVELNGVPAGDTIATASVRQDDLGLPPTSEHHMS
jgi:hypothetical protein